MERSRIDRLLERIAHTEPEELSCSECFELLDVAVELELAGRTETPTWRRFAQHVGQCGVCREEYDILKDFIAGSGDSSSSPPAT